MLKKLETLAAILMCITAILNLIYGPIILAAVWALLGYSLIRDNSRYTQLAKEHDEQKRRVKRKLSGFAGYPARLIDKE